MWDSDRYDKKKFFVLNDNGNSRSFEFSFVPECHQYSCCSR